jgi:hypothetical protein
MSIARMINRPCTIIQRVDSGQKDRRGNKKTGTVEVETVCELQQQAGFRQEDEGAISDTRWTLFLLSDQEIGFNDEVEVDAAGRFEVHGEPWKVYNPRTRTYSHIEVAVRRTVGVEEEGGGS